MFKRIIISALAVAAGMSAIFGCTNKIEEPFVAPAGEPSITLQLHTGKNTRATDPFNANEAMINSVDLFFFKGTDPNPETSAAVFAWHGGSAVDDGTLNVSIPLELIYDEEGERKDDLFDSKAGDQCTVYTVVNWSGARNLVDMVKEGKEGEDVTISKLRALKATTEFFATSRDFDESTGIVMFTNESLMAGTHSETTAPNVVKYVEEGTAKTASGHLYVKALAAKIDLFVDFAESVEGTDPTAVDDNTKYEWKPAMRPSTSLGATIPTAEVHLVNGLKAVRLGGWANDDKALFAEEGEYFDTRVGEDADGVPYWHRLNGTTGASASVAKWATNTPFYTYPNKWEISPLELHRTTLLLKVDWLPYNAGTDEEVGKDAVTTYYTVPLNLDGNELESSNYYRVKVKINTLGGQNFGEPVELDASVEILKWGHADLEADIREVRYLSCEQTVYDYNLGETWTDVMNNTEKTTIPFYSSHKVEIESVTVRYHYYFSVSATDLDARGYAYRETPGTADRNNNYTSTPINAAAFTLTKEDFESGQYAGAYIDEQNSTLAIYHQFHPLNALNNGRYTHTNENTYAPYEIYIKLRHKDNHDVNTDIKIIQYPPINIIAQKNNSSGNSTTIPRTDYGYVYVNGSQERTRNGFNRVSGIDAGFISGWVGGLLGADQNPNMYVFTVQNLEPEDAPWHIGDPRNLYYNNTNLETTVKDDIGMMGAYRLWSYQPLIYSNNQDGNWSASAPGWEEGQSTTPNRTLSYYYPTDENDADEQRWMISPKFRIASSHGSHALTFPETQLDNSLANNGNRLNRNEARQRCATYQEHGYPAGRWRLPTPGEMAYIVRLQKADIIPDIFETRVTNDDMRSYWTSHGLYNPNSIQEIITPNQAKNVGSGRNVRIIQDGWSQRAIFVGYVRCVYDDWYWLDKDGNPDILPEDKKTQFHWGDKEKTNPLE